MRAITAGFGLVLGLCPAAAIPQEDLVAGALARVPQAVVAGLRRDPARFRTEVLEVIFGRGSGGAITAVEVERALALDRAVARARAMRPLLESDLDGDGVVTQDEAMARGAVLAAAGRARLLLVQVTADADGDGRVSAAEMQAHAAAEAARAISAPEEARMRAILSLDLDGDARVTAAEVDEAVQRLGKAE